MAKRKEKTSDEHDGGSSSTPKSAQKKKYKTKKQRLEEEQQQQAAAANMDDSMESSTNTQSLNSTPKASKDKKKKKAPQQQPDDTSSDEERWLSAIEKGVLEEVDSELKNIKPKDPKLMTARQRAMYEKTTTESSPTSPTSKAKKTSSVQSTIVDGVQANVSSSGQLLLALPNFKVKKGKEKPPLTAEDIEKSKEKAQKRKQLADEKREKDKKKTMERILKKSDSKMVKSTRHRTNKLLYPVISYRNTANGIFLSFPSTHSSMVQAKTPIDPPKPVLCSISGCKNLKRYSCSKTNVPLCSLECYKRNVELVRQMIF